MNNRPKRAAAKAARITIWGKEESGTDEEEVEDDQDESDDDASIASDEEKVEDVHSDTEIDGESSVSAAESDDTSSSNDDHKAGLIAKNGEEWRQFPFTNTKTQSPTYWISQVIKLLCY